MPAQLVVIQARDAVGAIVPGAQFFTYQGGTGSVPQAVYSDDATMISLPNPLTADAAGRAVCWMDASKDYDFVLKNAAGSQNLWPQISNYTPRSDDILYLLSVDITAALEASQTAQTSAEAARDAALVAQTASETAQTGSETAETNSASSAAASAVSAANAAADAILTAADKLATNADAAATAADKIATNADAVSTAADKVATNADTATTDANVLLTAADAVSTAADAALSGSHVALTTADRAAISGLYLQADTGDGSFADVAAVQTYLTANNLTTRVNAIYVNSTDGKRHTITAVSPLASDPESNITSPQSSLLDEMLAGKFTTLLNFIAGLQVYHQPGKTSYAIASRGITNPVSLTPVNGDMYLLSGAGTGDWTGFSANNIAGYVDGAWLQITPAYGYVIYIQDEADTVLFFNGSNWIDHPALKTRLTMAALQAIASTALSNGDIYRIKRRATPGDGGAGAFEYLTAESGLHGVTDLVAGTGYTDGIYDLTPSGGNGAGALARVEVVGGAVIAAWIRTKGSGYTAIATLAASGMGAGSGFSANCALSDGGVVLAPSDGIGRFVRLFTNEIDPRWFGAKLDRTTDDAAPVQLAADFTKNINETGLPGAGGFGIRALLCRQINFGGAVASIESGINVTEAYGLCFKSGTMIASGTWAAGTRMVYGDITASFSFEDFELECNGKTNGFELSRGNGLSINRSRVFGFKDHAYGGKFSTAQGGARIKVSGSAFFGTIGGDTVGITNPSATCLEIDGPSDSAIDTTEFSRALKGFVCKNGGWTITSNKVNVANAGATIAPIGIEIHPTVTHAIVANNQLDFCHIKQIGGPDVLYANNDIWWTVAGYPVEAILCEPDPAGAPTQTLSNLKAMGNKASLFGGTHFVRLDDGASGNVWTGTPGNCYVEANAAVDESKVELNQRDTIPARLMDLDASGRINFNSGLLYVDPATGRVGINHASPDHRLHAGFSAGDLALLEWFGGANGTLALQNAGVVDESTFALNVRGAAESRMVIQALTDALGFVRNLMEFHHSGEILKPNQPSFLSHPTSAIANATGTAATGLVTLVLGTEVFDVGSNFASNTFTASKTGKYWLGARIRFSGITAAADDALLQIVTSNRTYSKFIQNIDDLDTTLVMEISTVADMDEGDTATVEYRVQGEATDVVDVDVATDMRTAFTGYLIG